MDSYRIRYGNGDPVGNLKRQKFHGGSTVTIKATEEEGKVMDVKHTRTFGWMYYVRTSGREGVEYEWFTESELEAI